MRFDPGVAQAECPQAQPDDEFLSARRKDASCWLTFSWNLVSVGVHLVSLLSSLGYQIPLHSSKSQPTEQANPSWPSPALHIPQCSVSNGRWFSFTLAPPSGVILFCTYVGPFVSCLSARGPHSTTLGGIPGNTPNHHFV
jgi:hypothetical protein